VKQVVGWTIAIALGVFGAAVARAQSEVTLAAPSRIREPIQRLLETFEGKAGIDVKATFGNDLAIKKQVAAGEGTDVTILERPYPEVLASGNVAVESETPLLSVSVGVAVRKGARKPDISTPDALRRTLLQAKSICYPGGTGIAGRHFEQALESMGLFDQLEPKITRAQGGAGVVAMVAQGEAEIGVTFMSELYRPESEGIDVVGALPAAVSPPSVLVGFISSRAKDPAAAKAVLALLSSPEAASIYRANGMQPAR
jgi:molybdate transport system substrate-binding protein